MMPACFDVPERELCLAAIAAGHDRFSSWALNVNQYADADSNPYVVGSAAYNAAHGLPPPPSWNDRTTAAAEQRALLAQGSGMLVGATSNANSAGVAASGFVAAPGLVPLAAIAILALLILKR